MEELNSGPLNTNSANGREEDLNPGAPDYNAAPEPLDMPCLVLIFSSGRSEFKLNYKSIK